jgi:hypothetical protein
MTYKQNECEEKPTAHKVNLIPVEGLVLQGKVHPLDDVLLAQRWFY